MSDHFSTKMRAGDVAHQIGRTIAGLLPGGADLLNNIIMPPLQRRQIMVTPRLRLWREPCHPDLGYREI